MSCIQLLNGKPEALRHVCLQTAHSVCKHSSRCFGMTSPGVQLNETTRRPPVVPSAEFDADYAYTLAFGAFNSTNRTAYETETAKFWYDESPGQFPW